MSFRGSWSTVQQRTAAFQLGAGDRREQSEILLSMARIITDIKALYFCGDPEEESATIPPYTVVEEKLAQLLSEFMFLCALEDFDVPEAMSARNTVIRSAWREGRKCVCVWCVVSGCRAPSSRIVRRICGRPPETNS